MQPGKMVRCPRCGSQDVGLIRRRQGTVERVAALVFLRPFRCRKCERCFLVYRPPSTLLG